MSAWLALKSIETIIRRTRLSRDTAIASTLAFFFAIGVALLSSIQTIETAGQAGIERFLFGAIATTTLDEAIGVILLACVIMAVFLLRQKEIFALCADEPFAYLQKIASQRTARLIPLLILLATSIGLQTIGLLLLVALLIIPAATALLITPCYRHVLFYASGCGMTACLSGAVISYFHAHTPTGATIVLILASQCALAFAYQRHWR